MNYKQKKLASFIVDYSLNIKPQEKVFINYVGSNKEFLETLKYTIEEKNAIPIVFDMTPYEEIELIKSLNEEDIDLLIDKSIELISKCDSFISLLEDSDFILDNKYQYQSDLYYKKYKKVIRDYRLKKCKWIGLRLPSVQLARKFNMSYEEFCSFYYDVCGIDYKRLKADYLWLEELMSNTNHIEISSVDTNISFDKAGISAHILSGEKNLPDGEIYTAPIKDTVNGTIRFNADSVQNGFKFKDISLKFVDGKIEEFNSNNNELFNNIINSDGGSKYVGEFAIGLNDKISVPHGVILYDEKILGSIHFALGQAYDDAYNGNDSCLHWDLVQVQKPEYGGGKVIFDDEIIMQDGIIKKNRGRKK